MFSSKGKKRWLITDKMFFSLFLTGAFVTFSHTGAAFFDGLIVSRCLGSDAMAAEGIAAPIFTALSIFSVLLSMGMQVRCAQEIGRGNREKYCRLVSATLYVGAGAALIFTVLTLVAARPFAVLLGASGDASDLLEPAAEYLAAVVTGALPMILSAILAPALQLDTGRRIIQTGAIVGSAANVILDIAAVKIGWGLFGVGLATAAANYISFFYQCSFFLKKDRILHLVRPNVTVKEFIKMTGSGSAVVIRKFYGMVCPVVLNRIIISFGGVAAMSVFSVQNNFASFSVIISAGIASAVSLLTGVYYGEINEEAISEVNRYEHKMIVYFVGGASVLFIIFTKQIAGLYVPAGSETFPMAVFAIRMCGIRLPVSTLVESRIMYLQAIHRKRNLHLLVFAQNLLFVLLSAFVLGRLFGSYGILACYAGGSILSLLSVYIYSAVKCRKIWPTRKDYLLLPEHYYLHRGDVISLDIRSQEDVTLGWRQIRMFCMGHHADSRTAYFAAMVFEELASNIIRYGFPQNSSSSPMIDLRVVISENNLVLRLRDNCPKYDITRQIAAAKEPGGDPTHNIGTRIVSRIASDITYLNTFDTNSLIIRFKL